MSVQSAVQFMRALREDHDLAGRLDTLAPGTTLQHLVVIGRDAGFEFTEEELRRAHAHDWSLRWIHDRDRQDP